MSAAAEDRSLTGAGVLITGGGRGQGRAHALAFARAGAQVAIVDGPDGLATVPYSLAGEEELEETKALVEAEGGACLAFRGDARSAERMQEVAAEARRGFGRLDVLIANHGITNGGSGPSWEADPAEWAEVIEVNLSGVWNACRAAIPQILAGERGGSVLITSSAAGMKAVGSDPAYTASKHGVVGLMKALAVELAPHSIRVNTVHPTGVRTPMVINPWFAARVGSDPRLKQARNLLDVALIEPEDVSAAMVFLASAAGRYVTGASLPVDAGFVVR